MAFVISGMNFEDLGFVGFEFEVVVIGRKNVIIGEVGRGFQGNFNQS